MPKLKRKGQLRKGKRQQNFADKRTRKWNIRQLLNREQGYCVYCRESVNLNINDPKQATIDHVTPISRGGLDVLDNLKLACRSCNSEKSDGVAIDVYLEMA